MIADAGVTAASIVTIGNEHIQPRLLLMHV